MALTAAIVVALSRGAYGDPSPTYLHMRTPSHVVTDGGSDLRLPPGYFLDEPTHDKVDAEVRRLQDAETRLTAENQSMRKSLDGWQPGFYTLAIAAASAIVLGWYAHDKL